MLSFIKDSFFHPVLLFLATRVDVFPFDEHSLEFNCALHNRVFTSVENADIEYNVRGERTTTVGRIGGAEGADVVLPSSEDGKPFIGKRHALIKHSLDEGWFITVCCNETVLTLQ